MSVFRTGRHDRQHSDRPSVLARAFGKVFGLILFLAAGVFFVIYVTDANAPRSALRQNLLVSTTGADSSVLGAVFVSERGQIPNGFGFGITPGQLPSALELQTLNESLKERFPAPIHDRRIVELESRQGSCQIISPSDLATGAVARALRVSAATACVVTSKHPPERRAVVVAVAMSREGWGRFAAKRFCRAASETALRAFVQRPDYAVCVLMDRTAADRKPPTYIHEVRSDGTLAWIRRR